MLTVRKSDERGKHEGDWLKSRHTFSFGTYIDPAHRGFSDLRVINEDWVQPSTGFGTHPHNDMEIFTYVLSGTLEHKDSMGNGSVIQPGDVQLMSAGTGVEHSEFNPSDTEVVHLLQIWIFPKTKGLKPNYQQAHFSEEAKQNRLRLIISPKGEDGSLVIMQNARVYAGLLDGSATITHDIASGRSAYVHVARGEISVNGTKLRAGDAVAVTDEQSLLFAAGKKAEILVFDLVKK